MRRAPHQADSASTVRGLPRWDIASFLTLWVVLLYGIPATQVVPGVGAMGSPAMLVALSTIFLWVAGWVLPETGVAQGRQPMRALLVVYLAFMTLSFAVGMSRPVSELEMTGAMRSLLTWIAMVGIALLVADGIHAQERLDVLLRRVVVAGALLSLLGIAQFLTGRPLQFAVPGLTWSAEAMGVGSRSIFNRPGGTTMHPIEFSVVTASLLPLAIHYALYGSNQRNRRNMSTAAITIAFAMPLAISRSGIVSVIVGLAVLAAGWSWRRRLNGALVAIAAVPILWAVVPGLVGTFASLFGDSEYDPSVQARIERWPLVLAAVRQRPLLGLGSGTWSVEEYFLLDNQLWATMLETGLIGLALVGLLFLGGTMTAIVTARMPGLDARRAHLGQALAASIAAFSVSILTFDAFFYRILTGTLFLLLGAAGALWRMNTVSERLFRRDLRLGPPSVRSSLRMPAPTDTDTTSAP
jgi:O-antigen ligase